MQLQIVETQSFQESYRQLTPRTQKIVDKKLQHLVSNHTHPSLRAHRVLKAKGENMWIGYVSITERLLYQFKDGIIYLWDVGGHSIVDRVHLRQFGCHKKAR